MTTTVACPRCGAAETEEGWCKACERWVGVTPQYRIEKRSSNRNPRRWMVRRRHLHKTAALMSLVVPGAGQVYKGRVIVGVVWFVLVAAGYYMVGAPGLLIHLMCVVMAGSAAPEVRIPFLHDGSGWTKQ